LAVTISYGGASARHAERVIPAHPADGDDRRVMPRRSRHRRSRAGEARLNFITAAYACRLVWRLYRRPRSRHVVRTR
jgi:hypothetical protein